MSVAAWTYRQSNFRPSSQVTNAPSHDIAIYIRSSNGEHLTCIPLPPRLVRLCFEDTNTHDPQAARSRPYPDRVCRKRRFVVLLQRHMGLLHGVLAALQQSARESFNGIFLPLVVLTAVSTDCSSSHSAAAGPRVPSPRSFVTTFSHRRSRPWQGCSKPRVGERMTRWLGKCRRSMPL